VQITEFFVKLSLDVGEDIEHHGDDNVEDDPLNDDIEDHKEDARPLLARGIHHHVGHGRPIVDDHEGVQSRDTVAQVIEIDQVVEVVGNSTFTVEVRLADQAAHSVHANHRENEVDHVKAGELGQQRRSHLHDHVGDDFERSHLLQKNRNSQVAQQESEREEGCAHREVLVASLREHLDIAVNRAELADDLEQVKFLLTDQS